MTPSSPGYLADLVNLICLSTVHLFMELQNTASEDVSVYLENIGGIESAAVQFSPGVTILVGRNATNRTSLLRGLMVALGSDNGSVKADADNAEAELTIGDESYKRHLMRRSGAVG